MEKEPNFITIGDPYTSSDDPSETKTSNTAGSESMYQASGTCQADTNSADTENKQQAAGTNAGDTIGTNPAGTENKQQTASTNPTGTENKQQAAQTASQYAQHTTGTYQADTENKQQAASTNTGNTTGTCQATQTADENTENAGTDTPQHSADTAHHSTFNSTASDSTSQHSTSGTHFNNTATGHSDSTSHEQERTSQHSTSAGDFGFGYSYANTSASDTGTGTSDPHFTDASTGSADSSFTTGTSAEDQNGTYQTTGNGFNENATGSADSSFDTDNGSFTGDSFGNGSTDASFGYHYEGSDHGFCYETQDTYPGAKKPKRKKKPSPFVTRRTLIVSLICCMVITSVLTAFGVSYFNGGSKSVSATNYTLAKATGSEKSIEEIVAMNENAVVEVRTEQVSTGNGIQNYVSEGAGSGVIIDSDGYILTCNHVIDGATSITVTLKNGKSYSASVVGTDAKTDVAVIKIAGTGFTAAQYGDVNELSVGDLAVAIGNPLGELGGTASTGIISSLSRQLTIDGRTMSLLQTDASINPGNSGGGLFDDYGNLIGIVVAKSSGSDVEGLGFAIPINKAAEVAKELIKNGKVTGRAMMGIKIVDATDKSAAAQYNLDKPGIYVASLESVEAQDAGLKVGDMFYSLDGKEIESSADLSTILDDHKPGDEIKAVVIRDGEKVKLTLTLIEAQ